MRKILWLILSLLGCGWAVAAPQSPAPGTCSPCTVILFAGQSNMTVVTTLKVAPPDGVAYDASFTGSITPTPLPAATLAIAARPTYGATTTTVSPSANSGTLRVTSVASGRIYAGQRLSCSGCAPGTVISSDQIGSGRSGIGTYVVTPAQMIPAGTRFTASEPNIAAQIPQCVIWSKRDQVWETYAPGANSDVNGAPVWGPEGSFCLNWIGDHPQGNLYMIKYAIGGQSLCPSPTGSWSPTSQMSDYVLANKQVTNALASLPAVIGSGNSYAVKGIVWVQGERDGDDVSLYCNDPVVYQRNLTALVDAFSAPAPASIYFTGSIDNGGGAPGDVLTAARISGGPLTPGQYVSIPGQSLQVRPYIDHQLTGSPGGAGTYALQVYARLNPASVTDLTSGAQLTAGVSGDVLGVTAIGGGTIAVGDVLSGAGVPAGATVAAFGTGTGSPGTGGVGWYTINVPLKVASRTLSAGAPGWGVGADSARFVYAMSRNYAPDQGVQTAQAAMSNAGLANLSMTAVNMYDARQYPTNPTHNAPTWIAELGRRLYLAWKGNTQSAGGCDLTTPTC
jgi:hypothetical protein